MQTIADSLYPEHYAWLRQVIERMGSGPSGDLLKTVEDYAANHRAFIETSEGTLTLFFLEAMRQRLAEGGQVTQNLYLLPDEGQQIAMFNFMATNFPVVRVAQNILNRQYIQNLQSDQPLTFVDIGIGTGQQFARMLAEAPFNSSFCQPITVIGIEPSAASMEKAQATLREVAEKQGLSLTIVPIVKTIEALNEADWQLMRKHAQGQVMINASFALHHVQPPEQRDVLFQQLKTLKPRQIGMIEPYADFLTTSLIERFANAWHHYGLTFRAIDQINATDAEKRDLKTVFFSREIQDVLSDDNMRVERFETGEMWTQRLKKAGFHISTVRPDAALDKCPPTITVNEKPDYLGFSVQGNPIISILSALA